MHRNTIETLNHWLNILIHPFTLLLVLAVIGIAYLVIKYLAIAFGGEAWTAIAECLKGFMPYLATFVFSFILSWLLGQNKNNKP